MDQFDNCKVGSWDAKVSQLTGIPETKDWVTPPGCLGCLSIELRPPSDRNYTIKLYAWQKIMPVSEGCGLIARVGDAMRCVQAPVVFCIFEADAGQVRSLTSLSFQASRSRNWLERIVHAAALETPQSQIGIVLKEKAYDLTKYPCKDSNLFP